MRSRNRILIAQTQRLSLNSSLSMAIEVLRADATSLTAFLEEKAAEIPALVVSAPVQRDWRPRWSDAFSRPGLPGERRSTSGPGPSLFAHVQKRIGQLKLPAAQRRIADTLAMALEPSGWLGVSLARIAEESAASTDEVMVVLARLQKIQPAGLFARDLAECLRLQAQARRQLDPVMEAVLARLWLVAADEADILAERSGHPLPEVEERFRRLRGYDPKPGNRFAQGAAAVTEPDLLAERTGAGWEVRLNRLALPVLSLAPDADGRAEAQGLIRLIDGRNARLLEVAHEILRRQEGALNHGAQALVPMTMAEVAAALGMHQTTVSRIVAGASVETPRGIWWLRALFSAALRQEGPAAAALRAELNRLVAVEDPDQPQSDAVLALKLAEAAGLEPGAVARRTVAKYRAMLGIPAAHRRRLYGRSLRG